MIDTSWALRVVEREDTDGRSPLRQREKWGKGPWEDEPDLVEWRHRGLACLIVRGPQGALCGYVGVPPSHPLHGKDYGAAEDISVHGGLTYSGPCQGHICHVPQLGEPEVWWLGFDCNHSGDIAPGMEAMLREHSPEYVKRHAELALAFPDFMAPSYKPLAYVRSEVETLAEQLAK